MNINMTARAQSTVRRALVEKLGALQKVSEQSHRRAVLSSYEHQQHHRWEAEAADRQIGDITNTLWEMSQAGLAEATNAAVGNEREFSCQPYHAGTMRVDTVELNYSSDNHWWTYTVHGTVIEGQTFSRLGSATSSRPMVSGERVTLHGLSSDEIASGSPLVYVYPV